MLSDDVSGRAALALTETLLLVLLEAKVISPDRLMAALETLIENQRTLAALHRESSHEGPIYEAVAHLIEGLTRGTNLQSAVQTSPSREFP